jgi:hypothetical protein
MTDVAELPVPGGARSSILFEEHQVMAHLLLEIALILGAMEEKPYATQNLVHSFRPIRSGGQ